MTMPQLAAHTSQPNKQTAVGKRVWKPWITLGLAASLGIMSGAWAGDCTFTTSGSGYCQCDGTTARVGQWNTSGTAFSDTAAGVNICASVTDATCSTAAAGAVTIGAFTAGETKYFANMTATSPPEYFSCTYTFSGISGFWTTAANTTPVPAITASANSLGGIIFAAAGLLLLGIWVSQRKAQKAK